MQAMNGSAASFRGRAGLLGCLMALVLVLSALVFAPAAANAQPPPTGPLYMALGDSISFGYTHQKFNENFPTESPAQFEEGVVNFFNKKLKKEVAGGTTAVNLACPGETSNGLIGEDEELGGKVSTEPTSPPGPYQGLGDWHPCAYKNVLGFPLHAGYGMISQLEDAVSILTSNNPYTGKPNVVKAITLNIGSNDELAAITQCEVEVKEEFEKTGKSKYGATPEAAVFGCIGFAAPNITFPHIVENIGKTIGALNAVGYKGPIVLIGFYNPNRFELGAATDQLQKNLNEAIEKNILPAFSNVTYANPFPVFNKQDPFKTSVEEKAICKYTEMCNPNVGGKPNATGGDIHPSLKGYKTLGKLVNEAYMANPAK